MEAAPGEYRGPRIVPEPASPGRTSGGTPQMAAPAPEEKVDEVLSPMVGTFYRAMKPDSEPFVSVGTTVEVGQVLCIIEAMKLMNEIEAEGNYVIRKILVENAQPVEYGQPLFLVESA
ncbi:MAG: acetyl-CoA carboxylase biotin carboxyl carrier protein [Candidatus Krumholzibacteriota bacterium]|nr:acetyl-CoA carboxylase biotin carboxyl carrier protein [Candidatus Krumholzibacteriota bacterium]